MAQLVDAGLYNASMMREMKVQAIISDEVLVASTIPTIMVADVVNRSMYKLLEEASKAGIVITDTIRVGVDASQPILNGAVMTASVRVQTYHKPQMMTGPAFITEEGN